MTTVRNPMAERGQHLAQLDKKRCDHCKAVIVWARTSAAHDATRMPVDHEPVGPSGNLILAVDDRWGLIVTTLGSPARRSAMAAGGWPLHQHHRLSCPFADDWNRPGGPKRSAKNRGR